MKYGPYDPTERELNLNMADSGILLRTVNVNGYVPSTCVHKYKLIRTQDVTYLRMPASIAQS